MTLYDVHGDRGCTGTYLLITDESTNPQCWQCDACHMSQWVMKEISKSV